MTAMKVRAVPNFSHLARMTDERGLFEQAEYDVPRREHGYCVDDAARALVIVSREPLGDAVVAQLAIVYLNFVLDAVRSDGCSHNRMGVDGTWRDEPAVGDWWGRALWGLGTAASRMATPGLRAQAVVGFRRLAQQRTTDARAMTFAAIGAGALLRSHPDESAARSLMVDAVAVIGHRRQDSGWPWPEPRLRYANGAVAEALILAGDRLKEPKILERGVELLRFLLSTETRDGRLSVTPTSGRGPRDVRPAFDQLPIEVAALADACATAYQVTGDPHWLTGVNLAWRWFLGDNDAGVLMFDPSTGGAYDGLHAHGASLNQGAEATLAMLSTVQRAGDAYRMR